MCSICSFTSLISPFETTLEDCEVMSSILTHDRMKKNQIFPENFNFFHIWPRAKFLGASPPRHPLEILAIENVMGWIQMINPRNLYLAIFFNNRGGICSWRPRDLATPPWPTISRYFFSNNRGESVADALGTFPRPRGPLLKKYVLNSSYKTVRKKKTVRTIFRSLQRRRFLVGFPLLRDGNLLLGGRENVLLLLETWT